MIWINCEGWNMPPYNTKVLTYWPGDKEHRPVFLINERPGLNQVGHGRWWTSRPDQIPTHWARLEAPKPRDT